MNSIDELKCVEVLRRGGVILYPTDTIWGIGCDATNVSAINAIYKLKERDKSKSLLILCSGFEQLLDYVIEIPQAAKELTQNTAKPVTIIYPQARNLPLELLAEDGSIGIRIPKHEFCLQLLTILGKPIVSTSANFSGTPSPISFFDILEELKQKVDYVSETERGLKPIYSGSKIIKITKSGEVVIIRE